MPSRLALAFTLALAFACGGEEDGGAATEEAARCAQCGMRVDMVPEWTAGLGDERFDAPKCLFRWAAEHDRAATEGWVMEYYSGERRPAFEVLYVAGSDVLSPMGDDLVPVEGRESAERFAADHGGRVVEPGAIDAALLASLDPR